MSQTTFSFADAASHETTDIFDFCAPCARPLLTLRNATAQGKSDGLTPVAGSCQAATASGCGAVADCRLCQPPLTCIHCDRETSR